MTIQDEVLRLTESVGFDIDHGGIYLRYNHDSYVNVTKQITKLIALVKAEAYEDAAKLCDNLAERARCGSVDEAYGFDSACEAIENAIRNRAKEQADVKKLLGGV